MTQQIIDRERAVLDDWISRIPRGGMAMPEGLTELVTIFASDASRYLTGQQIMFDGGYTAIRPALATASAAYHGRPPDTAVAYTRSRLHLQVRFRENAPVRTFPPSQPTPKRRVSS